MAQHRDPVSPLDQPSGRNIQHTNQEYSVKDRERDGKGMEVEVAGCFMGIPDRLRENLPFTYRDGAQSALGHPEMEHESKTSWRALKAPDLGTRGMER